MSTDAKDIRALLQSQAALIDELRTRVARLEASGPAPVVTPPARLSSTELRSTDDESTVEPSRRGFLRLAGAAAAGAAVAAVANATPAAALDGGTYSGSETVFTNSTSTDPAKSGVKGTFTTAAVGGIGVLGQSDTTSAAAGVVGSSLSGYGVYGSAGTGYALYAGSNGRLGFDPHLNGTGAPTSGAYKIGDIVVNTAGDTYSCVVSGSGGAARFSLLAGPSSSALMGGAANDTRNTTASTTTVTNTGAPGSTIAALRGLGPANSNGILGSSSGASGAGVRGTSDTGAGIVGESATGYALYGGGSGRIGLAQHVLNGPPTSGTYAMGDLVRDGNGGLFFCVAGGTPGTWRTITAVQSGNVLLGAANDANNTVSSTTTITNNGASGATVAAIRGTAPTNSNGIIGTSNGAVGTGVRGTSDNGFGVVGESATGYALYAAGNGRLGLAQNASAGPPFAGTYAMGDLVRDGAGNIFYCVAGGSPGTWRSLLNTAPAVSQLHLIAPTRIYDSRSGDGPYGPGTDRLIPPHPSVPNGASAVLISLLVFGLSGAGTGIDGYVTAYAAGTTSPGTVNAYWGNIPGTQISSTTVVQISSSNQFRLRSTTAGGSVSLAVDLLGYYL